MYIVYKQYKLCTQSGQLDICMSPLLELQAGNLTSLTLNLG